MHCHYRHHLVHSLLAITQVSRVGVLVSREGSGGGGVSDGSSFFLVPVVDLVLIPVVDLFFQGARSSLGDASLVSLAELQVRLVLAGHGVVVLSLPSPLEHALVVPGAEGDSHTAADHVGGDVVKVELAVVGEDALDELGADAEDEGADDEGQVEGSAAIGVDDPVEDGGEEEEGDKVEDLVVDVLAELDRCQAGVGGDEEQQHKGAWRNGSAWFGKQRQQRDAGRRVLQKRDEVPAKGNRTLIADVLELPSWRRGVDSF